VFNGSGYTSANVDDRVILKSALKNFTNSTFGADAGYCGKNVQEVAKENGNIVLAAVRKNMKFQVQVRLVLADLWGMKTLGTLFDQKVLNLRSVVETCFSVVKTRLNLCMYLKTV